MRTFIGFLSVLLASGSFTLAQQSALLSPGPASGSPLQVVPDRLRAGELEPDGALSSPVEPSTSPAFTALLGEAGPAQPQAYPTSSRSLYDAFELGLGIEFLRFRSTLYKANLAGVHTSFIYFRKEWLGFEGNVVAAFGSSSLPGESSRAVLYTAGPRVAWHEKRVRPWVHALVGGLHIRPQTSASINSVAFQLGGGVDWPYKPMISFRAESDYVRSQLNSSGQNSFQFGAGIVFHF